jgi:hypothetical protein
MKGRIAIDRKTRNSEGESVWKKASGLERGKLAEDAKMNGKSERPGQRRGRRQTWAEERRIRTRHAGRRAEIGEGGKGKTES